MNDPDSSNPMPTKFGAWSETTRSVTFVVLIAYIALLIGFIVAGYRAQRSPQENWFELIKIGFTTMGSALTLILGYYFGQREVLAAKDAKQDAERHIAAVETSEADKRGQLVEKLKQTARPSQPDSIQAVDKGNLPKGKPSKDASE